MLAAPALASNVSYPATYAGAAATGGTIEFDVTDSGTKVTRFALHEVPLPPCVTSSGQTTRKAAIVNDSFANGAGFLHFSGTFLAVQQAQGTISYHGITVSCDSEEVSWTATAMPLVSPPPPPPVSPPPPMPPVDESPPPTSSPSTISIPAPPRRETNSRPRRRSSRGRRGRRSRRRQLSASPRPRRTRPSDANSTTRHGVHVPRHRPTRV